MILNWETYGEHHLREVCPPTNLEGLPHYFYFLQGIPPKCVVSFRVHRKATPAKVQSQNDTPNGFPWGRKKPFGEKQVKLFPLAPAKLVQIPTHENHTHSLEALDKLNRFALNTAVGLYGTILFHSDLH